MPPPLDPNIARQYARMSDEEREAVERSSYNFRRTYGYNMRLPPSAWSAVKACGVDMRYIDVDPSLGD